MDDALGDAFVVEVEDLFAQDEIFQQGRSTRAGFQAILVIRYADALVGRQIAFGYMRSIGRHVLMRFPAIAGAGVEGLVHEVCPC